jgi:fluoride exporter
VNGLLWVACGGAMGAVARHVANTAISRHMEGTFPWGIFCVNVLGCFAMGLVTAALIRLPLGGDAPRLFLATGVLGGFTTFSAFSVDVMRLLQMGQPSMAAVYIIASVSLSIAAAFFGFALIRMIA